jgi:hypothetical protein
MDFRKRFEEAYGEVLDAAEEGELRCSEGRRWNGNAILIIVDAALDSIGLNYFQIIVPRVKRFYEDYVNAGQIVSLKDFSRLSPHDPRLRMIMNNERCWKAAINICKKLNQIKIENGLKGDFEALRFWAERANYENWRQDPIGGVSGVGLITFQYLRLQAGVDTTMPDKIVKGAVFRKFGIEAENDMEFIRQMEALARETGYSQTLICWAIWLKEANVKVTDWEKLDYS